MMNDHPAIPLFLGSLIFSCISSVLNHNSHNLGDWWIVYEERMNADGRCSPDIAVVPARTFHTRRTNKLAVCRAALPRHYSKHLQDCFCATPFMLPLSSGLPPFQHPSGSSVVRALERNVTTLGNCNGSIVADSTPAQRISMVE